MFAEGRGQGMNTAAGIRDMIDMVNDPMTQRKSYSVNKNTALFVEAAAECSAE